MTENPEPKFCCSLWLYYIRFPKTVVNKMKIKMTKFLNTSYRRAVPAATTCRWGISRLCVNRNAAAGIADSVADKTPGASCPPLGARVSRQCY